MTGEFPRHLIRRLEKAETFPLAALEALRDLNGYLYLLERRAIRRASDMGASAEDIAECLGVTRQGAYYKLKTLDTQTRRTSSRAHTPDARTERAAADGDRERAESSA